MLVLSLDTTSRAGSCALARDGRLVRVQVGEPSREHEGQLPMALGTLLDRESVTLQDIDGYGVAIGPGSFTGLRVGIATMQGLAMATDKPLVGVSALDALARLAVAGRETSARIKSNETARGITRSMGRDALIVAWIDAWRGNVFSATYEEGRAVGEPTLSHPEALLDHLKKRASLFIGDGAARNIHLIRAACGDHAQPANPIAPPLAGAIAGIATEVLNTGQHPLPHTISPLYVRQSDANFTTRSRPV